MKYLYLFFISVLLWACTSDHPHQKVKTNYRKIPRETLPQQNVSLPFGCNDLMPFTLSDYVTVYNQYNEDPIRDSIYRRFARLHDCYWEINRAATISHPLFSNVKHLKLEVPYQFKDLATFLIDSVRYRLPNIGPYQCYYSYQVAAQPDTAEVSMEEEELTSRSAGNLIFYNPADKSTTAITIYLEIEAFERGISRFFFIGDDKEIIVYDFKGDEVDVDIIKRHVIKVDEQGRISMVSSTKYPTIDD